MKAGIDADSESDSVPAGMLVRVMCKERDASIVVPARKSWTSYPDDAPAVSDEFLRERPALIDEDPEPPLPGRRRAAVARGRMR